MKSIASIIFFLPLILFLVIMLFNMGLLWTSGSMNIPFLYSGEAPIVLWIISFFVAYVLGLWATFKFSNFFSGLKKNKLGNEVSDLKAELYDKQGSLIDNIKKEFDTNLSSYKDEANKDRKTYKAETDKILNNLQFEITQLTEKMANFETAIKKEL